jgi:hypothetical protein
VIEALVDDLAVLPAADGTCTSWMRPTPFSVTSISLSENETSPP